MRSLFIGQNIRKHVAAGAAALCVVCAPVAAVAESLADALAGAYTHSGLLDQNRALLRAADEDVAVAISRLRPVLQWSSDITRTFGENYSFGTPGPAGTAGIARLDSTLGLSAEMLLYDGGRTKLGADAAKETVLATRQSLVSIEQSILLRAVQAFMDVRATAEIVALRQNNIRVITEELRAAQDRFEVGEVTRTDVALTEARLAGARSLLAQAQGDYSIAVEAYQAYVGRAPGKLAPPPAMKRPVASVDAAKAQAMKLHPSLKQAQHQVAAADIGVEIAKRATMPRVTLNGTVGSSSRANSPYWQDTGTIGLRASGVIYQGGQLRALTRKAVAQRDAARGALHDARSEIGQNVGGAFARVKVAQAALAATDEQIRAARVAFQGVREEAALGSRTTLDVLNAEQELLDAQANRISAASNEYVAYYSLLASMGLLTVDQLNLKVTRYDPAEYYNLVHKAPTALSKQGKKLDKVLQRLGKE